jgi:SepF-like predicted cell division protein (DUF552 family)
MKNDIQRIDQFEHDVSQFTSYLRSTWKDLVGKVKDMCEKTTSIITSPECSTESLSPQDARVILDEIKKVEVQMVNDLVKYVTISSAINILIEVLRLREV